MSDKIFTLGDLRIGQGGYIKTVDGDNALRRRIVDMGITPGTYVRIIKTAPMGDFLDKVIVNLYPILCSKFEHLYRCVNVRIELVRSLGRLCYCLVFCH